MGQILHGSAKTTHAVRASIQRSKAWIQELNVLPGIMSVAAAANKIRNARNFLPYWFGAINANTSAETDAAFETMGRERPDAVGCSLSRMR